MTTSLAEAFVTIRPDTATFKTETAAAADTSGLEGGKRFSGGFSKSFKGIAAGLAGAFVVKESFDFFKDAIKDADAYRTTANLTAAAIKSTGGAAHVSASYVEELSEKLAATDGVSKGTAQSVANMVLRFANIKNIGAAKIFDDTTTAALNMSAATGKSATAAATQLGRALDNPTKNLSALTRSGVTFSVSQTALIKKLADSGHLLEAQKIILGQVSEKYGGAAAAAATPLDKLKTSANELQLTVGSYLVPKLDSLAKTGTAAFAWAQKNPQIIKEVAVGLGALASIVIATKVATAGLKIAQDIAAVATKAWAAGQWLLNAALDANPIGLIVIAIAALVAGIIIAYKESGTFRDIVKTAMGGIVTAFHAVVDAGKVVVAAVVGSFQAVVGAIRAAVGFIAGVMSAFVLAITLPTRIALALALAIVSIGVKLLEGPFVATFNAIKTVVVDAFKVYVTIIRTELTIIKTVVTTIWHGVEAVFEAVAPILVRVTKAIFTDVVNGARNILSAISGVVSKPLSQAYSVISGYGSKLYSIATSVFGKIKTAATNIVGDMVGIGGDIVHGIIRGIESLGGTLSGAVTGFIDNNVPKPVRKLLHISSPSKVFAEIGANVTKGMVVGIQSGQPQLRAAVAGMVNIPQAPSFAAASGSYGGSTGSAARATAGRPVHVHLALDGHEVATAIIGPLGQLVGNRPLP